MESVESTIEIHAPAADVFARWQRFEDFPHFMHGILEAHRQGEDQVRWVGDFGRGRVEWVSAITLTIPSRRIAWRTTEGPRGSGALSVEPLDAVRTQVTVQLLYDPGEAFAAQENSREAMQKRLQEDLERFRRMVEQPQAGSQQAEPLAGG